MNQAFHFTGTLESKPQLVITPGGNYTAEEGRSTVFTCKIVGGNIRQPLIWFGLDDRKIKEDYRYYQRLYFYLHN